MLGRSRTRITIPNISAGEPKVAFGLTRNRILSALTTALFVSGAFTFGFVSSLHLKSAVPSELRKQYLLLAGRRTALGACGGASCVDRVSEGIRQERPQRAGCFHESSLSEGRRYPTSGD